MGLDAINQRKPGLQRLSAAIRQKTRQIVLTLNWLLFA